MVGQYTETRDDVRKSFELMEESVRVNLLITYAFTITTPFPGSILYDLIFEKKLMKSDEEFHKRYTTTRIGDWNQVVNLSEIPDDEVVMLRIELEKSFLEEKRKAYGRECYDKINTICKRQTQLAEIFNKKSKEEEMRDESDYSTEQLELEKRKLALMGAI